jgi:CRP/FNR family transcriptional regulator, anaerobic regulatory protein
MSKKETHIKLKGLDKIFKSSNVIKTYRKGDIIYYEGDIAKRVYRVLKGRVKIWKYGQKSDRKIIFYFIHPLEIFGTIDFINKDRVCRFFASALDNEVIIQYVSYNTFEKALLEDHDLRLEVIQSLIKADHGNMAKYFDSEANDLTQRVFNTIKKLAHRNGLLLEGKIFLEAIPQKELADYFGVSRQSITTALNNLRRNGKIEYNRNRIIIIKST